MQIGSLNFWLFSPKLYNADEDRKFYEVTHQIPRSNKDNAEADNVSNFQEKKLIFLK